MTREAIWGMEINKIKERARWVTPRHNAALPFTRFVVGHGDYTPFVMRASKRDPTTIVHQMALLVVFDSAIQTIAEHPLVLLDSSRPHYAILDVVKKIPTLWDETIVLPESQVGSLVAFARRKGDTWFLGIINGESGSQKIDSLALPFIDSHKEGWNATLISSKPEEIELKSGKNIVVGAVERREEPSFGENKLTEINLLGGDGFVGVFEPL